MSDFQRKPSPRKLLLISNYPTGKEVDKNVKSLPEEIQKQGQKIVYYEKLQDYLHVSWCTRKKFLSDLNCYELCFVNH